MPFTPELLGAAPRRAVRLVAQQLLSDLVDESVRLGEHPEALHDFRVALRRLRSWLRAFRPWLRDTVRKRTYRELAAIADASSAGRDAEVALKWLGSLELPPRAATGVHHLAARVRRDERKATRAFHAHVDADFPGIVRRLGKQLASYRVNVAPDDPVAVPTMAAVLSETVRQHAVRFDSAVRSVSSADDETDAHDARIAGKRLRYLLEQFDDPRAGDLVKQLAGIQDALGELHDTHVLIERIAAERAALAKKARVRGKPDPRPGLYALAARTRARSVSAYAGFRQRWDERGDEMLESATRIAGSA
jgi:CHAD domain-containing protein